MNAKYDDVLVPFVSLMRRELHANAGKGDRPGWLRMDPNTALLEVYYHLAKLQKAVKHNDGPAIMEYSADVANMAMMVLDICGGLAWVELPEGRNSQHVLKAEGASPDATDRENCANASPDGGPMGAGQAAAAAPSDVFMPCGKCKNRDRCEERGCVDRANTEPAPKQTEAA